MTAPGFADPVADPASLQATEALAPPRRRSLWRVLFGQPITAISVVFIVILIVLALLAPWRPFKDVFPTQKAPTDRCAPMCRDGYKWRNVVEFRFAL